ncbi:hypothetical protein DW103_17700 [Parabacteroides sp. AM08-6]|nr:Arm DNA-binding domain-containing protein [Parabacteroides sp. AM08-6]RHJ75238.1 hypothetical protein DW103_17700 [Parabacteroides sp. AM08-6]
MSTTVSVVCYKSKVLKNNESPLMLRVCKNGKRKYESIGISLNPKYWDFKANKPTSNCPNREHIEKVITEKRRAYADKILELKAMVLTTYIYILLFSVLKISKDWSLFFNMLIINPVVY